MGPNSSTGSFFGQKVSKQGVNVNTAGDSELIYKMDYGANNEIWYDNNGPRVIMGKLPDGSYGLMVSKPGFDVTTATIPQLAFSSGLGSLVVARVFTDSVAVPGVSGSPIVKNYAHQLDAPVWVLLTGSDTAGFGPLYSVSTIGVNSSLLSVGLVDLNTIKVNYPDFNSPSTYNVTINVFVLTEV